MSSFNDNIVVSMFLSGKEMLFVIEIHLDNLMASKTDLTIAVISLSAAKFYNKTYRQKRPKQQQTKHPINCINKEPSTPQKQINFPVSLPKYFKSRSL